MTTRVRGFATVEILLPEAYQVMVSARPFLGRVANRKLANTMPGPRAIRDRGRPPTPVLLSACEATPSCGAGSVARRSAGVSFGPAPTSATRISSGPGSSAPPRGTARVNAPARPSRNVRTRSALPRPLARRNRTATVVRRSAEPASSSRPPGRLAFQRGANRALVSRSAGVAVEIVRVAVAVAPLASITVSRTVKVPAVV